MLSIRHSRNCTDPIRSIVLDRHAELGYQQIGVLAKKDIQGRTVLALASLSIYV